MYLFDTGDTKPVTINETHKLLKNRVRFRPHLFKTAFMKMLIAIGIIVNAALIIIGLIIIRAIVKHWK